MQFDFPGRTPFAFPEQMYSIPDCSDVINIRWEWRAFGVACDRGSRVAYIMVRIMALHYNVLFEVSLVSSCHAEFEIHNRATVRTIH